MHLLEDNAQNFFPKTTKFGCTSRLAWWLQRTVYLAECLGVRIVGQSNRHRDTNSSPPQQRFFEVVGFALVTRSVLMPRRFHFALHFFFLCALRRVSCLKATVVKPWRQFLITIFSRRALCNPTNTVRLCTKSMLLNLLETLIITINN